jgi:hypothetical protein
MVWPIAASSQHVAKTTRVPSPSPRSNRTAIATLPYGVWARTLEMLGDGAGVERWCPAAQPAASSTRTGTAHAAAVAAAAYTDGGAVRGR